MNNREGRKKLDCIKNYKFASFPIKSEELQFFVIPKGNQYARH